MRITNQFIIHVLKTQKFEGLKMSGSNETKKEKDQNQRNNDEKKNYTESGEHKYKTRGC